MKHAFPIALAVLSLSLSLAACRTLRNSGKSRVKDVEQIDAKKMKLFPCDKGELAHFVLRIEPGVKETDFDPLPQIGIWGGWSAYVHSDERKPPRLNRLDVCMEDDQLVLKQYVFAAGNDSFTVFEVEKEAKVEGLTEAIFDNDYSKLDITLPVSNEKIWGQVEPTPGSRLIIKGSKTRSAAVVYSQAPGRGGDRLLAIAGQNIADAGRFEYETPVDLNSSILPPDCKLKESDPDRSFKPDDRFQHKLTKGVIKRRDFTIEWVGYPPVGSIEAREQEEKRVLSASADDEQPVGQPEEEFERLYSWQNAYFCKATITDKNPALGDKAGVPQSFIIAFQGPETERGPRENFRYLRFHHNWGNAWWIKTKYAVYSFRDPNTVTDLVKEDPYFSHAQEESEKVTYLRP